jgi:hypothetical protein
MTEVYQALDVLNGWEWFFVPCVLFYLYTVLPR